MPALTNGLVVMTPTSVDKTGTGSTATINSDGSVIFDSCTALSLNGVFTSSYDNYMMVFRGLVNGSTSTDCRTRLRLSGVDSTTGYVYQYLYSDASSVVGARATAPGFWYSATFATTSSGLTQYLFGPNLAQPTAIRALNPYEISGAPTLWDLAATHSASTSYDGITMYEPYNRPFKGLVTVFGFNQ